MLAASPRPPSQLAGVHEPARVPRQRVLWRVISHAVNPKASASYTDSQSRTVVSLLPEATIRPSGLKHTEVTIPL